MQNADCKNHNPTINIYEIIAQVYCVHMITRTWQYITCMNNSTVLIYSINATRFLFLDVEFVRVLTLFWLEFEIALLK